MVNVQFYFEKNLNLSLISDTWKKAFNGSFDIKYWKWRFESNPNDKKIYISYIIENETLASYYAISACTILYNNDIYKIALSNMTMTHPEYQGKGYFKLLAKKLYNILKKDGYIAVYGFANSNSHYGFRKYLNWIDICALNTMKTEKKTFREFLLKNKDLHDFEFGEINENIIALTQTMKFTTNKIYISRDIQNLRWRVITNPSNKYYYLKIKKGQYITAIILFKYFGNNIDIMEYFYKQEFDELQYESLGSGISYLLSTKTNGINIWSNLYSDEHLYLEKLGFVETEFNTYFGVIPFIESEELTNIKNWHYRFIDSDIY